MEPAKNDPWKQHFGQRLADYQPGDIDDSRFLAALEALPKAAQKKRRRRVKILTGSLVGLVLMGGLLYERSSPAVEQVRGLVVKAPVPAASGSTHRTELAGKSGIVPPASTPWERTDSGIKSGESAWSNPKRDVERLVPYKGAGRIIAFEQGGDSPKMAKTTRQQPFYTADLPQLVTIPEEPEVEHLNGLKNKSWALLSPNSVRNLPLHLSIPRLKALEASASPAAPVVFVRRIGYLLQWSPGLMSYSFRPNSGDETNVVGVKLLNPSGRLSNQLAAGLVLELPKRRQLRLGLTYQSMQQVLLIQQSTGAYWLTQASGTELPRAESMTDTVSVTLREWGLMAEGVFPLVQAAKSQWYGVLGGGPSLAAGTGLKLQVRGGFGTERLLTADGRLRMQVELGLQYGLGSRNLAGENRLTVQPSQAALRVNLVWKPL